MKTNIALDHDLIQEASTLTGKQSW